jgi:hypothetical protein
LWPAITSIVLATVVVTDNAVDVAPVPELVENTSIGLPDARQPE